MKNNWVKLIFQVKKMIADKIIANKMFYYF